MLFFFFFCFSSRFALLTSTPYCLFKLFKQLCGNGLVQSLGHLLTRALMSTLRHAQQEGHLRNMQTSPGRNSSPNRLILRRSRAAPHHTACWTHRIVSSLSLSSSHVLLGTLLSAGRWPPASPAAVPKPSPVSSSLHCPTLAIVSPEDWG